MNQTLRTFAFTVPVPASELSPNSRPGWRRRATVAKQQRKDWYTAALAQRLSCERWSVLGPATISLAVTWCQYRRTIDDDNLWASVKAGRDGLQDAGIIRDDSPRWLTQGTGTQAHCPPHCYCGGQLVVTITEDAQP